MLLGKITSVAVTWHGLHEKGSSPQWVAVKQVVTVVCSASICILIQRKVLIYIDWWSLMISSDGFPVGLPRPTISPRAGSHICTPVVLQQTLCCIILYLCIKCIILPIMWVLSPLSCFLLLLREGVRKKPGQIVPFWQKTLGPLKYLRSLYWHVACKLQDFSAGDCSAGSIQRSEGCWRWGEE